MSWILVLAQLAAAQTTALPVLAFPEAGLDDTAAYRGYQTRFFHDAAGNTVQVYLDRREGRIVHLWANAENESIGLTVRDSRGSPAALRWASAGAQISRAGRTHALQYALTSEAASIRLGWFLLGSMRVERDFQAQGRHRAPFGAARFVLPEITRMLGALERLNTPERSRQLQFFSASDTRALRARLHPSVRTIRGDSLWIVRIVQPTLDNRDTLALEVRVDPRQVAVVPNANSLSLRSRTGGGRGVTFTLRIETTGVPLTPVTQQEIFTPDFLQFVARARAAGTSDNDAAIRARWLERQVRGVELLSSREKLMAGLPTYATYFGRDMLMSALMMRSIWRAEMSEFVVGSVLRKLSPTGQVSHEEALGGQAVREAAAEYAALVDESLRARTRGDAAGADSLMARARNVLRNNRRVRENYNMIDDDLQFPVLTARWIVDSNISPQRKRAFLRDSSDGTGTRLDRLLLELALVARMTEPYAKQPTAANLISFAPRDSGRWASTSWRDSNVGYGGGRYAMDVNAIWAPHALDGMAQILSTIRALGFSIDSLAQRLPALASPSPLARYARDSAALASATASWSGAWRHFLVQLSPLGIRARVAARLAALPAMERSYWMDVLTRTQADDDSLTFLALSLDAAARPIGVANSDPATRLFLGEAGPRRADLDTLGVLRDVRLFVRHYPVGLFIDSVGPVVANDAYSSPAVWLAFERDRYHGPRVAWGREVNLFVLGVANRIDAARTSGSSGYLRELRAAAEQVQSAVEASGFQSELWTYRFEGGRPTPIRYGSGADVQLWSTTDLAVQYALSRLGPSGPR